MGRTIAAWLLLTGCATTVCYAGGPAGAVAMTTIMARVAQADEQPLNPKGEASALLKQAREAMDEGRLETAESFITQAEALDVSFGLLHFGDTPKKARRQLAKLQKAANKQAQRPSAQFDPNGQQQSPTTGSAPMSETPGDALPSESLYDARSVAERHLKAGRRALETGNLPAAEHHYRKALEQGATFAPEEDSPQKLGGDIERAGGSLNAAAPTQPFTRMGPPPADEGHPLGPAAEQNGGRLMPAMNLDGGSSPFGVPQTTPPTDAEIAMPLPSASGSGSASPLRSAREQSDLLLLGARRAVAVGDTPRARQLVDQAASLGVEYAFQEDQPAKVRETIEKFEIFQQQVERGVEPIAARRQHAQLLLEQGEWLLKWNDFDTAERVAVDAQRLGVDFGVFEASPQQLIERIETARRQTATAGGAQPSPVQGAQLQQPPVQQAALQQMPAADAVEPAASAAPIATAPADAATIEARKRQGLQLVAQARAALSEGNLPFAESLARQAEALNVPDTAYAPGEDRPALVLFDIDRNRWSEDAPGTLLGGPPRAAQAPTPQAQRAVYEPARDPTRTMQVQAEEPAPPQFPEGLQLAPTDPNAAQVPAVPENLPSPGVDQSPTRPSENPLQIITWGEQALEAGNLALARTYFQEASRYRDQLDADAQARLDQSLQRVTPVPGAEPSAVRPGDLLPDATEQQRLIANQLSVELARREAAARQQRDQDPQQAIATLEEARAMVEAAGLDSRSREILLRRVDRTIDETRRYIEQMQPRIELNQRNQAIEDAVQREKLVQLETQEKLAQIVDDFNTMMREERFAEAELLARRAEEIAPEEMVVQQLKETSRIARNLSNQLAIRDASAEGFVASMDDVQRSAIPPTADFSFGPTPEWIDLTARRASQGPLDGPRRSPKEIEIEQRLRTPVSVSFRDAPLSEVLGTLAQLAQVNIFLDELGIGEAGITTDDPVTIELSQEVQLRSALDLVLAPRGLAHVIKDEVLYITSEHLRDGHVYPVTYNVADLVMPIPNFIPHGDIGMAGALRDAYGNVGYGTRPGLGSTQPLAVVAGHEGGATNAQIDPNVLAQFTGGGGGGGGANSGVAQSLGFGPGGMGGGAQADFDELIELITTTVAPTSWDEVGGPGSIREFQTNLSLVVSQTFEVHEQIVDLLEQLRRLQDLQVTIEVRFITLNDNFFERIGVDFDFDVDDDIDRPFQVFGKPTAGQKDASQVGVDRDIRDRDHGPSVTVGQSAPGVFSTDLDIPFRQDSFTLAVPQFGGFDASAGASIGFAILSDLEAFFFINAAQGDSRTNVLQAPKVTLFNGQAASVADVSQSPFVISVIPVVADFAAAQQPVIVVLSEGTFLTVQAVVSSDRRFIRLTVVPFFSQIRDVDTFTFTGSTTTTEDSSSEGPDDDTTGRASSMTTVTEGTTVQLPTFAFVSVTTTVSVPDGGTVLLGGIKRLSEGRNEAGVPFLNKLPYVNRLFKNVGIGRETQSLMMMVTPRIIIQEEEEALILNNP